MPPSSPAIVNQKSPKPNIWIIFVLNIFINYKIDESEMIMKQQTHFMDSSTTADLRALPHGVED